MDSTHKDNSADKHDHPDSGSLIFAQSIDQKKSGSKNKESGIFGDRKTITKDPGIKEALAAELSTGHSDDFEATIMTRFIVNPVWLSVSEAAKLGGVQAKTIRRAIQSKTLKYKIVSNRYAIDLASLVVYLHTKTKLKNKLNQFGLGQYIKKWIE